MPLSPILLEVILVYIYSISDSTPAINYILLLDSKIWKYNKLMLYKLVFVLTG